MSSRVSVGARSLEVASPGTWSPIGLGEGIANVPIVSLLPADSPRLGGEVAEHIRLLAESKTELPPIIVHRATRRVIDGMHRLRAAMLRGEERVPVVFVDCVSTDDAFVIAVKSNVAHGLPLTMTDRQAAAQRIVLSHPQWSDRIIASATGLSDKTVRSVRARVVGDGPQPSIRIGQDGRVRPLSGVDGRRLAGELMRSNPQASLRQIAKEAGVSVGTAHDVRKRLQSGQDPVAVQRPVGHLTGVAIRSDGDCTVSPTSSGRRRRPSVVPERAPVQDPTFIIHTLMKDPALRYTDSGRILLRWLTSRSISIDEWSNIVESVPPHCTRTVATYARRVAESWAQFASELEQRDRDVLMT